MSVNPPSRDDAAHVGQWTDGRARDSESIGAELEELLVHGAAGVVATDLDGVITHWSAGAQRLYGWSADEAIGQPVIDLLIVPNDRAVAETKLESIHLNGGWEGEFLIRCKDGGVVTVYSRGTLIKDDAGRPVGVLGLSMDVSAPPAA